MKVIIEVTKVECPLDGEFFVIESELRQPEFCSSIYSLDWHITKTISEISKDHPNAEFIVQNSPQVQAGLDHVAEVNAIVNDVHDHAEENGYNEFL